MEDQNAILIALGVLLTLSPMVKSLMERLGAPALVGYLLLGFFTSVLNQEWGFIDPDFENTFAVLAQLGVVALLFRVGLKSNTRALLDKLPDAAFLWMGDVLTNLLFGYVVAHYVLSLPLEASLVVATAFSATSVAVSVAVWDELRKLDSARGQLLVDVAELDDLSGVLLLALLAAIIPILQGSGGALLPALGNTALTVLVKLVLFITGCYLFSHYVESAFTRFNRRWENSTTGLTISVLGAGLAIAAVAGLLGFSVAIGALFAGLAFSRDPEAVRTDAKFTYFYEFLTPFFFIYIGMQVNPGVVGSSLGLAAVLFVPAVLGKFLGVGLPALRILRKPDALLLGVSMIPRAEIAIVIIHQCHQFGGDIVPDKVFAAVILVAVMTSVVAPPVLRRMLLAQPGRR